MRAGFSLFATCRSFHSASRLQLHKDRICLVLTYLACAVIHSTARLSLLCHSITHDPGTGISTCFPSTTPLGLALGPGLPRADEPSPGILGLSVCRILTCISLLTPAFSLPIAPTTLPGCLQRGLERSPTHHISMMPKLRYST